jgi:bifunctional non-homologous end joining protein LigD
VALEEYERKRDLKKTPEPGGKPARKRPAKAKALRFVVQEHHATRLHWDLRLEHDGVLVSFAVPNGLPPAPGKNHLAVHTEDHPLEYLTFHGEIPKGNYGAGSMTVWDTGTYEVIKWEDRKIEVHLHGERVDAQYALFPLSRRNEEVGKDWMVHRMDPPSDPAAAEPLPYALQPMLAQAGALPPDDDAWAFEIKWDGVRAIAYSEPGTLRFESRNANDITRRYPELAKLNRALSHHRAILDGEVVAFDADGKPSFGALQGRMHLGSESQARRLAGTAPVTYVIFDLLWLDGHLLTGLPYAERRARLGELGLHGERWQTPDFVTGNGAALLAASQEQGLEGIVAKRLTSTYDPGHRSAAWLKIKNVERQEVVIAGWLPGEGRRKDRIGALLVGVRDEDGEGLRYAGRVGTGFDDAELERLKALLGPLERATTTFTAGTKPPRGSVFAEPELVCEVEFREWTRDAMLRHPSYKGLRDDKPAALVIREETPKAAAATVDGREVKLSNLGKVLYPKAGFTKRDVIDFYAQIAPVLLPHLAGRPLTLKRYPNGVEADFFYEKNAPSHRPDWVATHRVPVTKGKTIDFVIAQDVATLVWLANLADLELHTSLARAHEITQPTTLAFDLDPGPPATIVECCRVALWLHAMFGGLGLECFAKTSGSKGMQVYLPLNHDGVTYEQTKPFAKAVAELLEAEEPALVVSRQTKAIRAGKVLVDWSQNDAHKTTVNVYSLRARDRPTVSTPVAWDEVRACAQSGDPEHLVFTASDVLRRVGEHGDLFAPVQSLVQRLPAL